MQLDWVLGCNLTLQLVMAGEPLERIGDAKWVSCCWILQCP
jgi:hypothetical protein